MKIPRYLLDRLSSYQRLNPSVLRWTGFGLLIITLSIWLGLSLKEPNTFPIKRVIVEGDYHHLNQKKFKETLMPLVNTGFFSINVDKIQDQLATLPWLAKAHVKRVWPDQITITVNEREAVGLWQGRCLLDSQGEQFCPPAETFPEELIDLSGPAGMQQQMLKWVNQFNQQLAVSNLWVVGMRMSPSLSITIELNNHLVLVIGQREHLKRLARFLQVYRTQIANTPRQLAYADLRYPSGFALRWRN